MHVSPDLHPTLWRTCRVLANHGRLKIFEFLHAKPDQPVSSIAEENALTPSVASRYLRLLESRGLLEARRVGKNVKYRIAPSTKRNPNGKLIVALISALKQGPRARDFVFRQVTAFTHPRRIKILGALFAYAATPADLRRTTAISLDALRRHLTKLRDRRIVKNCRGRYKIVPPASPLHRELLRLAKAESTVE